MTTIRSFFGRPLSSNACAHSKQMQSRNVLCWGRGKVFPLLPLLKPIMVRDSDVSSLMHEACNAAQDMK